LFSDRGERWWSDFRDAAANRGPSVEPDLHPLAREGRCRMVAANVGVAGCVRLDETVVTFWLG
jgi:hypothetical protein